MSSGRCDDYIVLRQLQHRQRPGLRRLLLWHSAARTAPSVRLLRAPVQCLGGGHRLVMLWLMHLRQLLPRGAACGSGSRRLHFSLWLWQWRRHPASRRRAPTRPALAATCSFGSYFLVVPLAALAPGGCTSRSGSGSGDGTQSLGGRHQLVLLRPLHAPSAATQCRHGQLRLHGRQIRRPLALVPSLRPGRHTCQHGL